ncbi:MAG: hypothetical protein JZD41_03615 [Thermoproteus sp.]|nr:hypothetical protein [Thermoproteus sp.]
MSSWLSTIAEKVKMSYVYMTLALAGVLHENLVEHATFEIGDIFASRPTHEKLVLLMVILSILAYLVEILDEK